MPSTDKRNQFYLKKIHEPFSRCFGPIRVAGNSVPDSAHRDCVVRVLAAGTQNIDILHQPIGNRRDWLLQFNTAHI